MWQGKLLNIHTARAVKEPMQPHETAQLIAGVGLKGDRYATGLGKYSDFPDIREVTLIEVEYHLYGVYPSVSVLFLGFCV